ncbi:hypothetical protein D910_04021 [Dendroctonus ponderosae]|uniref:Uncharacterized protein n=1 Tax=Dendroctonus ponderosae TaxID=77166 RepID=U4TYB0_DENPD|nr:hypothetical protein D910_04021 [Dendroctonus ponderosae]
MLECLESGTFLSKLFNEKTKSTDRENESNSAEVNRPHIPKDIFVPSEHGLIMYWHIGRSRKAKATVAITKKKNVKSQLNFHCHSCLFWWPHFAFSNRYVETLACIYDEKTYKSSSINIFNTIPRGEISIKISSLFWHASKTAINNQQHGNDESGHPAGIHDGVGPLIFDCLSLAVCHHNRQSALIPCRLWMVEEVKDLLTF